MDNFDLYFIGFYKHDAIQFLLDGPFATGDAAEKAIAEKEEIRSGAYVVCKTTLPFEVVEV